MIFFPFTSVWFLSTLKKKINSGTCIHKKSDQKVLRHNVLHTKIDGNEIKSSKTQCITKEQLIVMRQKVLRHNALEKNN